MRKSMTVIALACLFGGGNAMATTLYSDQMTSGAGWGINSFGDGDHLATFGYDYSADGIAEAPNSQGGDTATRGLKMQANLNVPMAAAGFTVYPLGQNFTGTYQLRFDAWMNYDNDERLNGASAGTTEFIGGGVGYDNVTADIGSGVQNIATGDGGSSSDWRVYEDGTIVDPSGMAAGSRNASDPYYVDFLPGQIPPGAQGQPAEAGADGAPGFQWITWLFTVTNDGGVTSTVDIDIMNMDGDFLRIVSVDCLDATLCTNQGNIGLYYADLFTSVTARPDLTFGLIDNVFVVDGGDIIFNPNEVPEPGMLALFGLGAVGLGVARRRARRA